MKTQFIIALLVLISYNIHAQERVGLIEGEVALGLVGGAGHDSFASSQSGEVAAEMRINILGSPLSLGLQFGVVKYSREGEKSYRHEHTTLYADYNHRPHSPFNLFAGIGLGYGETVRSATDHTPSSPISAFGQHFVVAPRLGAELFNTLRLTLESKIISREYTYWGMTLGFVVGGWRNR